MLLPGSIIGDDGMAELELTTARHGPVPPRPVHTREFSGGHALVAAHAIASGSEYTLPRVRTCESLIPLELLEIGPEEIAEIQKEEYHVALHLLNGLRQHFVSAVLASVPFFNHLPEATNRKLGALFEVRCFARDELIFRQGAHCRRSKLKSALATTHLFRRPVEPLLAGDPGDCMYIVLHGHVQIWAHEKTRAEKRADADRIQRIAAGDTADAAPPNLPPDEHTPTPVNHPPASPSRRGSWHLLRERRGSWNLQSMARDGDPNVEEEAASVSNRPVVRERLLAEYHGGTDQFPWFGEVFQWVHDHGRAGDGLCVEETLTLALGREQMDTFVRLAPGFKALAMSAATSFFTRPVKHEQIMEQLHERRLAREMPLRYALRWAKMVTQMIGINGFNLAVAMARDAARKKREHEMSIQWARELITSEGVAELPSSVLFQSPTSAKKQAKKLNSRWVRSGQQVIDMRNELVERAEERVRELAKAEEDRVNELANTPTYGDGSQNIALVASSRAWREALPLKHQVRAEVLRRHARENPDMEQEESSFNKWLRKDNTAAVGDGPQSRRRVAGAAGDDDDA